MNAPDMRRMQESSEATAVSTMSTSGMAMTALWTMNMRRLRNDIRRSQSSHCCKAGFFRGSTCFFYYELIKLVKGELDLTQENIKSLEKSLSEIERNINETRSILARLRDIEKQVRCLNEYAKPEKEKTEEENEE